MSCHLCKATLHNWLLLSLGHPQQPSVCSLQPVVFTEASCYKWGCTESPSLSVGSREAILCNV